LNSYLGDSSICWTVFDFTEKKKELKKLEEKIQVPDFWQKEKEAAKIQKEYAELKEKIEGLNNLKKEIEDCRELLPLVKEGSTEERELKEKIAKLSSKIKDYEKEIFLSGTYDRRNAILNIQAGAGGRDAEDWVTLLARMYQKFAERKNWKYRILSQNFTEGGGPEGRIGLRDISMEIKGKFAYGLLKREAGVHRLVRISPFSAQGLRHTSFAKVEVLPEIEQAETDIKIRPEDLKIETFRASGPGGQYVNRRETAVRITHLPTGITVSCQTERLQGENRKRAMQVLIAKLYQLQEQKREKELEKIKGKKVSAEFGNQIRSYVFHPYKLVKDHRTGVETSDVEEVLDGNLDQFIEEEIKL
jgi:peptide chain release factor 2